jgi:D-hexose-6-phosphate mutarotase
MSTTNSERKSGNENAGHVAFLDGQNEMPMIEVNTPWSRAGIYFHGAHLTDFTLKDQQPLLFMSQCSRFADGQPIRGGIPVIFPWFGPREGQSMHGFARLRAWDLKAVVPARDGSVGVHFSLPECPEAATFTAFKADYIVTVGESLKLQLAVTNKSETDTLAFEDCLHTYFSVSDATAISIKGLKGVNYLDRLAGGARKTETDEVIRISSEVDRAYLDATGPVEILDPRFGRRILIEKQGSASTVVWNPWIAKSQAMPDFGNDEYTRMVCVESGNVGANGIRLAPGQTSTLTVKLSSQRLD